MSAGIDRSRSSGGGKDSIGALIAPCNGFRGAQLRKGVTPKDHHKENRQNLRDAQERNRQAKQHEVENPPSIFKMKEFQQVPSKVAEEMRVGSPSPRRNSLSLESPTRTFLQKGQGNLSAAAEKSPAKAPKAGIWKALPVGDSDYVPERKRSTPERALKPAVPRRDSATEPRCATPQKNFIAGNIQRAKRTEASSPAKARQQQHCGSPHHQPHPQHQPGEIPEYLLQRKEQWAADAQTARENMPDPDCPEGMVQMPEAERVETLRVLRASEEEGKKQLSRLPLRVETPGQKAKKGGLEKKLSEIEDAIRIFSREKVFVHE